jgi:hypothetical protein
VTSAKHQRHTEALSRLEEARGTPQPDKETRKRKIAAALELMTPSSTMSTVDDDFPSQDLDENDDTKDKPAPAEPPTKKLRFSSTTIEHPIPAREGVDVVENLQETGITDLQQCSKGDDDVGGPSLMRDTLTMDDREAIDFVKREISRIRREAHIAETFKRIKEAGDRAVGSRHATPTDPLTDIMSMYGL